MKKVNKLKFHIIKQHTKEITAKLAAKVLFYIQTSGCTHIGLYRTLILLYSDYSFLTLYK